MLKPKPIVLPDHIRRSDLVLRKPKAKGGWSHGYHEGNSEGKKGNKRNREDSTAKSVGEDGWQVCTHGSRDGRMVFSDYDGSGKEIQATVGTQQIEEHKQYGVNKSGEVGAKSKKMKLKAKENPEKKVEERTPEYLRRLIDDKEKDVIEYQWACEALKEIGNESEWTREYLQRMLRKSKQGALEHQRACEALKEIENESQATVGTQQIEEEEQYGVNNSGEVGARTKKMKLKAKENLEKKVGERICEYLRRMLLDRKKHVLEYQWALKEIGNETTQRNREYLQRLIRDKKGAVLEHQWAWEVLKGIGNETQRTREYLERLLNDKGRPLIEYDLGWEALKDIGNESLRNYEYLTRLLIDRRQDLLEYHLACEALKLTWI